MAMRGPEDKAASAGRRRPARRRATTITPAGRGFQGGEECGAVMWCHRRNRAAPRTELRVIRHLWVESTARGDLDTFAEEGWSRRVTFRDHRGRRKSRKRRQEMIGAGGQEARNPGSEARALARLPAAGRPQRCRRLCPFLSRSCSCSCSSTSWFPAPSLLLSLPLPLRSLRSLRLLSLSPGSGSRNRQLDADVSMHAGDPRRPSSQVRRALDRRSATRNARGTRESPRRQ